MYVVDDYGSRVPDEAFQMKIAGVKVLDCSRFQTIGLRWNLQVDVPRIKGVNSFKVKGS